MDLDEPGTSRTSSLGALLASIIRRRVEDLALLGGAAGASQDEVIHELRLATKELRAYLRLFRLPECRVFREREGRRLRAIARGLASNRDPLVIRETLEELAHQCDKFRTRHSIHRVLIHMGGQRVASGRRPLSIGAAMVRLQSTARALVRRLGAGLPVPVLVEALRHEYRRTRNITRKVRRDPDVASWHRWRKHVKALHYQIRWLLPRRAGWLGRLARKSWKLQALLGRYHDLHLTRKCVRRLRVDPINRSCREQTVRWLDRSLARLERRVRRETRDFLLRPPRWFAKRLPTFGGNQSPTEIAAPRCTTLKPTAAWL